MRHEYDYFIVKYCKILTIFVDICHVSNKMSKISIIIPVHNAEKYLRTSVGSLKAQTYGNIEIVLVENASTDGSLALCHEIAAADDMVKVIQCDFGDPSNARNEGILASTGEYIGFIDSDDTVEPDMYEQMLNIASKEDLDIIICDFVKKYDYRSDRREYPDDGTVTIEPPMELLKKNFKDQIPQSACTLLCRKKLFEKVKFPVGRYFEDTATTWRLLLEASRAGHIARSFYHYYRHEGSIVHTASFKIHYGHVLADMERVDFINSYEKYSDQERYELGARPLALFYKHFGKMVKLAQTDEEKLACVRCRDWALSLSDGYKLKIRYSLLRTLVHNCWGFYCILKRGSKL